MNYTQVELAKAIERLEKRKAYNLAWRERNPQKVKAYSKAWRQARDARDKAILAHARELQAQG